MRFSSFLKRDLDHENILRSPVVLAVVCSLPHHSISGAVWLCHVARGAFIEKSLLDSTTSGNDILNNEIILINMLNKYLLSNLFLKY